MRKITIQPPNDKKWHRWCADCQKATDKLHQQHMQGEDLVFEDKLYSRRKDFFKSPSAAFYGKCAYCECSVLVNQRGDIDHFRPKASVSDVKGIAVQHPGYYWLAYDWRNLLLSCILCNQIPSPKTGNVGKGTRFPVIGDHAQTPDEIDTEQPLLINPASDRPTDDPAEHLDIDLTTGLLIAKSDRGRTCIEVFGLNTREHLIQGRLGALSHIKVLLMKLAHELDEKVQAEITEVYRGRKPFSLVQITYLEKFQQRLKASHS
jgi:uncharacterized protein (TIGR02646 family)